MSSFTFTFTFVSVLVVQTFTSCRRRRQELQFFLGANNGGNYYHGFLIEGLTNARANQNSWVMEGFWNSGPVKRHLPKFWYLAVSVGSYLQPSGLDYWGKTTVFILGWGKSTQGSFGFLVLLFRFYV